MSYDLVRGIRTENGKVFLKSASNNVCPRTYHEWECSSLSKILQEQGQEVLDLEILEDYEKGNMQAGTKNKYTRALEVLWHMPEYQKFNWRGNWEENDKNRKEQRAEFLELLKRALKTQLPKDKYIITKTLSEGKAFGYHRRGSRFCKWYWDKAKATIFRFKQDAEEFKKGFTNSENWEIEQL